MVAKILLQADIHYLRPTSTIPGQYQVFRCFIWLDMGELTVVDRLY